MAEEFEKKGEMHENAIACCKAGIGNKLLWMLCETYSAVIRGWICLLEELPPSANVTASC